jgi:hypothetical protein
MNLPPKEAGSNASNTEKKEKPLEFRIMNCMLWV